MRLAAARTLSRPDIRELNPGTTLDFIGGFRFRGNPDLVRATIWNYDLRAELFPSVERGARRERVLQGLHRADRVRDPALGPAAARPINSETGRNLGVEVETRVDLARRDARGSPASRST